MSAYLVSRKCVDNLKDLGYVILDKGLALSLDDAVTSQDLRHTKYTNESVKLLTWYNFGQLYDTLHGQLATAYGTYIVQTICTTTLDTKSAQNATLKGRGKHTALMRLISFVGPTSSEVPVSAIALHPLAQIFCTPSMFTLSIANCQ